MLSVENPPGSSCSCKVPALKSDERAPNRLAFPEADPAGLDEKQPPHFSIRDYVFTSRSKDIATNWPFPQKNLQLCLKHGVRDLLPPFEPPDLVRARCSGKSVSYQQVVCIESERTPVAGVGSLDGESNTIKFEVCLLSDQSVLGSSEQAHIALPDEDKSTADQEGNFDDELTHGEAEIESTVTSHDQIQQIPSLISTLPHSIQETKSVSDASTDLEVAIIPALSEKVGSLHEPSEKKCRLIVKFGTVSEPSRLEDIASNSSMVSDSMASKVCPVCKTFSSTSNTTLNAHIDQCLSVESNTKSGLTKLSNHKVKPRKKRSMVDICATAPRCTLADLDKRNGSNWALDLTLVAPTNVICTEIKRPRLSPVDPVDDGSEGEVYVDSNGTKLRILSKFNASPPAAPGGNFKLGKLAKETKEGKIFTFGKKKRFSPEYGKYMKVKTQSRKLSSFKPFKGDIQTVSEGKLHLDTHQEKEECVFKILSPQDQIKSRGPATLSQWVCSKRSGLSKKLNYKFSYKSPGNLSAITRKPFVVSNQPDSGKSSAVRSHILKLSRPSDDFTSSLKTKSMDFLSNTAHAMDHGGEESPVLHDNNSSLGNNYSTANGLLVKLSKSSGNYVSSPRSKRVEIHQEGTQKCRTLLHTTPKPFESCHPFSRKAKKNPTLIRPSCTLEASKCKEVEKSVISKKFRKHRSLEEACKPRGQFSSDVIEQFHDSTKDSDLGSASSNQTNRTSYFPENIMRPETEDGNAQISPSQSNIPGSKKETECTSIPERGEYTALKCLPLGAECHGPELANVVMQVEASASGDTVTISSVKKAVSIPSISVVPSEDYTAPSNAKLDSHPSLEECMAPTGGTEAWVEPSGCGLSDDPVMHCGDEASNDLIWQNIQMAGLVVCSAPELQQTKCQTDTASIQGSSTCLTSTGETCLELPQENSSATSIRIVHTQDDKLGKDRETSGSPVSVASTISQPSMNSFELRDVEPEPPVRPDAVQDKSSSDFSDSLAIPSMAALGSLEKTNIERRGQEFKAIALAQEPKFRDAQPCCCSRRESLSKECQLLRQSIMGGTTLSAKGNQMTSNLYIRPVNTSYGTYPSLRTEEMTNPVLESPTDSFSSKASSDSAARITNCGDFGLACPSPHTQPQSTTSPILRLMGKNLMIMSKDDEESVPLQKVVPCSPTNPPNTKYSSLLGFSSMGSVSNQDILEYHRHQFLEGSMITGLCTSNMHQVPLPPPTMRIGGFMDLPLQNGLKTKTDMQAHQKKLSKKHISSIAGHVEKVALPDQRQKSNSAIRASNLLREVIVIDDSPEFDIEPKGSLPSQPSNSPPSLLGSNIRPARPFSCFPSQNTFPWRELSGEPKPGFPISCPRANFNSVKQGSSSEGPGPLLPRSPFMVPSLSSGHLPPRLYYSPSLR